MMTTKEIAIALKLPANTDKDYLFDLEDSVSLDAIPEDDSVKPDFVFSQIQS